MRRGEINQEDRGGEGEGEGEEDEMADWNCGNKEDFPSLSLARTTFDEASKPLEHVTDRELAGLDGLAEPELDAGAVQVLLGMLRLEIDVTVKIVLEEA